ncbi:hypothetical protein K8I61_07675 [bacterium]|nr:hypothetical protein [bacterium]
MRTDVDAGKPAWRIVWDAIEDELDDDIGTLPGRIATNRSNRFAVASNFNARVARGNSTGPFWCQANKGEFTNIPQCRPDPPFAAQSRETKDGLRLTDRRAESTSPFRLFGTGSVGSQILTGIPRLAALRFDEGLAKCSSVWPFETGWAAGEDWPGRDIRIVHAEIYPTIREQDDDLNKLSCGEPGEKPIKDRRQVRTMWHWAKRLDSDNKLWREFAIPHGIAPGSREDEAIRSEEGWILGCPPLDSDHR